MLIGKNWKIESDEWNVILYKRHPAGLNRKTGKMGTEDTWSPEGYYSTIKNALSGMVDYEIRATELKELKTISAKIEELYAVISSLNAPGVT